MRALASRVDAQLATLASDSTLSVTGSDGHGAVRTIVFQSDHLCEVVVRSDRSGEMSVELHTASGDAFDIELTEAPDKTRPRQSLAVEPALFSSVTAGPIRLIYSLESTESGAGRYQTEWVLIP